LNYIVPQEILEVEQLMDEQVGMELTDENVEQVCFTSSSQSS